MNLTGKGPTLCYALISEQNVSASLGMSNGGSGKLFSDEVARLPGASAADLTTSLR